MCKMIEDIKSSDFRRQIMTVEEMLCHITRDAFKRDLISSNRTSVRQRSRFIECLLMGLPQTPLYVDDSSMDWTVLSGMEAIDALVSFCKNGMHLTSLYFKTSVYEGRYFEELSPLERNKLLNTQFIINVLNPGLTDLQRFGIYMWLKPRYDAKTLKWCRERIYLKQYQKVESLAKDISIRCNYIISSSTIEMWLCQLLVGANYQTYINDELELDLDAASNMLLEDEGSSNTSILEDPIVEQSILDAINAKGTLKPRGQQMGIMISVIYHHKKSGDNTRITEEQFAKYVKMLKDEREDNTASFCKKVKMLMESYVN